MYINIYTYNILTWSLLLHSYVIDRNQKDYDEVYQIDDNNEQILT